MYHTSTNNPANNTLLTSNRLIVIIPALNEEDSIGLVLTHIPQELQAHVIVCDNASTDRTAIVAAEHGAIVVHEQERGYGAACLRALEKAREYKPEWVVFLDADYSDTPEEMLMLLEPLLSDKADLVIGSRRLGMGLGIVEPGALLPQARFGNWLATWLIRFIWGVRFTDLGPFRAITWKTLEFLNMQDRNFGWTVEMQVKAAQHHLRCMEIPVSYRVRIGKSKILSLIHI